ncbi:MAG: UvrD-helicase domain-containing protein [Mollicutes bacterium]|nr:UvrD-helicase domain-containing protein [Mollicutes bacterium]
MTKWTEAQKLAINKTGKNIIVSAGAGSGKTAVLTQRVITHLKNNIKINKLLILTFTNAAAGEMRNRIRKKISKDLSLKDNLYLLDTADITTFDAYCLHLVKKYHFLLNIDKNLKIIDEGLITLVKDKILDEVFDNFYEKEDLLFLDLIENFSVKDDKQIKEAIKKIIKKIDLVSDKEHLYNDLTVTFFNQDYILSYIKEYEDILINKISSINDLIMLLEGSGYDTFYNEMVKAYTPLLNSKTYDEIKLNIEIPTVRRPKGSEDIKDIKDSITLLEKEIKSYLRYENTEEILTSFSLAKNNAISIVNIIKIYYEKLNQYKFDNDLYEFIDIEILIIKLLKENDQIRKEVKNSYYEIMIDEYQDTSDLQEEFINLIENNNVYMVGDIKQSIYGFRNANPLIFKDKYDKYAKDDIGIKIDLLHNFRSRPEVIEGINTIFSLVMDDNIGGANYKKDHQMLYGLKDYDENYYTNSDLEILNYNDDKDDFTKEEKEAFIIGQDILSKLKKGYEVYDPEAKKLRKATFSDFCIIMDRGTSFNTYYKIFEYLKIPLYIYQDEKIISKDDIIVIKNLVGLYLKVKNYEFDYDFKFYFTSIARSFLINMPDEDIYNYFKNKTFKDSTLYQKLKNLPIIEDSYVLINTLLKEFNFYEKLITLGDIKNCLIRVDNILSLSKEFNKIGFNVYDICDYLNELIESKYEITVKGALNNINSVLLMNIHKSKGLEYPICYYSGYHKTFNIEDIKDRFLYDKKYGLITPYYNEKLGNLITKELNKHNFYLDDISERIRLFYVALTRAREKIIIVTSLNDDCKLTLSDKNKYSSFLDIIESIKNYLSKYIIKINLDDYNLTKDYLDNKKSSKELKKDTKLIINKKIDVKNNIIDNKKISKEIVSFIDKELYDNLEYGTYIHKVFERSNFFNISKEDKHYNLINNFVKTLNITKDDLLYKEHEFIYEEDGNKYHGIIDLIIESDNEIKIIDYKLNNIIDESYKKQLKIYEKYLKSIKNKPCKLYLYSILLNKLEIIE